MADTPRHHLPPGNYDEMSVPRHLNKLEFARRLSQAIQDKSWNQAELARQADISRDSISTYIRGRSMPSPVNLKKIAEALNIDKHTLLPNAVENATDNDAPSFEMREASGHPGRAWVRVNRLMSFSQALAIAHILENDDGPDAKELAHHGMASVKREEEQPDLPLEERR